MGAALSRTGTRLVRVNDRGYAVGEDHHRSKLTNHEVDLLLELLAAGMSQREVARKFEVSQKHVWRLAHGTNRSQLITRTVRRADALII